MKVLFAFVFAFVSQLTFIPSFDLLFILAGVIVADFSTGCYKSRRNGVEITSGGFRKTIDKLVSYLVAVCTSSVLVYVSQKKGGEAVQLIASFLNDGLVCLLIYIEMVSICENIISINKKAPIAQYFFIPIHKFLTLQLKRSQLKAKADEITKTSKK